MQHRIDAVKSYLGREFPGKLISNGSGISNFNRSAHWFGIDEEGTIRTLLISFEFLGDYAPDVIKRRLAEWDIARSLREVGATHIVLVTREGVSVDLRR
jgi:hypothetical protein